MHLECGRGFWKSKMIGMPTGRIIRCTDESACIICKWPLSLSLSKYIQNLLRFRLSFSLNTIKNPAHIEGPELYEETVELYIKVRVLNCLCRETVYTLLYAFYWGIMSFSIVDALVANRETRTSRGGGGGGLLLQSLVQYTDTHRSREMVTRW